VDVGRERLVRPRVVQRDHVLIVAQHDRLRRVQAQAVEGGGLTVVRSVRPDLVGVGQCHGPPGAIVNKGHAEGKQVRNPNDPGSVQGGVQGSSPADELCDLRNVDVPLVVACDWGEFHVELTIAHLVLIHGAVGKEKERGTRADIAYGPQDRVRTAHRAEQQPRGRGEEQGGLERPSWHQIVLIRAAAGGIGPADFTDSTTREQ
jgi:hypothetical protein